MQQQIRYRVSWNEHKGSYEIQHFRPRVIGWLGMKPDSADWFILLKQIPSFAFQARNGGHFTARKETRARGGAYWIAYRHSGGQLIKKYIGSQANVTIARLEEIAGEMERRTRPPSVKIPANLPQNVGIQTQKSSLEIRRMKGLLLCPNGSLYQKERYWS